MQLPTDGAGRRAGTARGHPPAIQAALEAGGNSDFEVRVLPELNPVLQTSKSGSPLEYAELEESFSPRAMQAISDWLLARFARPTSPRA